MRHSVYKRFQLLKNFFAFWHFGIKINILFGSFTYEKAWLFTFLISLVQPDWYVLGEPYHVFFLNTRGDVRLRTVVIRSVLDLNMDDEVKVVPQKVVLVLMSVKTFFSVTIKLKYLNKKYSQFTCWDHIWSIYSSYLLLWCLHLL